MHSAANNDDEMINLLNGTASEVTDVWETVHIASFTGSWDHTREHLRHAGFNSLIDLEMLETVYGPREWDHLLGYHDEGSSFLDKFNGREFTIFMEVR